MTPSLPGPLTLIRAGDWVADLKDPDTRWFVVERTMFHHLIIRRDDLSESKVVDADKFTSGEWIVTDPNLAIDATIAGAYNAPEPQEEART